MDVLPGHRRRLLDDGRRIDEVAEGLFEVEGRQVGEAMAGDEVYMVLLQSISTDGMNGARRYIRGLALQDGTDFEPWRNELCDCCRVLNSPGKATLIAWERRMNAVVLIVKTPSTAYAPVKFVFRFRLVPMLVLRLPPRTSLHHSRKTFTERLQDVMK